MKDFRKFCRPKTTNHPLIGDVLIRLNCGEKVFVKVKDYLKVLKSFKIDSIIGETSNSAGNVKVLDKLLNREIVISIENYVANPNKFELINVVGSKFDPYKGHQYVEIGGLKWATMNVDASQPSDYGLYFAWGDTQGYTAEQVGSGEGQKYFGWADYKYGNGTSSPGATGMTKYNATDGKTVLEASDDAAVANWGGSWRIPTTAEFQSLGAATTSAWTSDYEGSGVAGLVLTDKTDSSKTLFFPAAGRCYNGRARDIDSKGYYWSSSLSTSRQYTYGLEFYSGGAVWGSSHNRFYGFAVRAVVDAPSIPDGVELVLTGDIIVHSNTLNQDVIFSYSDWLNLSDDWDLVGLYGITTYEEENAANGDYVIIANGHTLIIKPEDYSKVSSNWELVDTI